MKYCRVCGKPDCKVHILPIAQKINNLKEFSGSSPPEIFIGKWNYPNVYVGILSPTEYGNTEILSSQELWHQKRLSIPEILGLRNQLIYGRVQSNIKRALTESKFMKSMQEVAMASSSIATEFKLLKSIGINPENENHVPLIRKAAQVKEVRLEENPKIDKKIDSLTNDTDVKSRIALLELEKSNIPTSTMIKVLSAGLLGIGKNRKLVPTRWSITAVDDTLSREKLKKIKYNQEISDILLFSANYLGNHYEFLLLPDRFSFEVIEINQNNPSQAWHDQESFFGRKDYASSVTGAYYANRLALTEYLEKTGKQASCLVIREISSEYTQSMGVGILRQISREAFSSSPERFSTLSEALERIRSRIKLPLEKFTDQSIIIQNYGKQRRLDSWF